MIPLGLAPAPSGRIYRRSPALPADRAARLRGQLPLPLLIASRLVRAAARDRVVTGPFCGMKVSASALSRHHLASYLLGTYELELRPVLSRIIARRYGTILNLGAADGYYAVGLALRSRCVHIEAFEGRPEFHPLIRRAVRRNRVSDRIRLNGKCTADALRHRLESAVLPALLLVDAVDETDLVDLRSAPELRCTDILAEAPEWHLADALIDRFWRTHNVECYTAQLRILADFPTTLLPALRRWFPRLAVDLMDEQRGGIQHWLFLTAKSEVGSGGFDSRDLMPVAEGASG